MKIDAIKDGIVIDHIPAGSGMRLYELLKLDDRDVSVAIIKNVASRKMGKKDIIKIDSNIAIDYAVIGFVAASATVNIIKNGTIIEKVTARLPEKLVDVISCKNPRCITCCEQELKQIFNLTDKENKIYRCAYCETKAVIK